MRCLCCGSILSLVQIFFPFVFVFAFVLVMYDNNMITSLKQKKRKFEPRIKLNHNIYFLARCFAPYDCLATKDSFNVF